ncbi:Structural maintenance of chromosomes protein 6 [Collariella sp. IMI 366227]|nr:Structural maintenance of chromosomes protein 6 [Collariella sp. IMI 366227]
MPGRTINGLAESSRKRARHPADDPSDDDRVEIQEAHSNLRTEPRKRARLSDIDDLKSDARPSTPHDDGQYTDEINFEHLRHEAADDQRATQRLRFRPGQMGQIAIADNGIIESVTCVNFMCHIRLHCELGPLLNFIVGENGSGKSAILTAITLCLGGKASSTNRGGSLKSFVKEGSERAVLTVKIKNRGQDAYKPDIYGESIIVERHFAKAGASGFKIKTVMGQTHSTKKQEVDEIVEYYALQVDNPLNILSQDNARQFLNASTKAQKYKFFIEGVQLQQLDNDYRLISESLEQMVAKVPDQEDGVKHAKTVYDKSKRLMDELEGNRQLRTKLRTLRFQMAWCQVDDAERTLKKYEKALAESDIRIAETEAEVEAKNQALELACEKVERYEQALEAVQQEDGDIQERVKTAADVFTKLRTEINTLHMEEREAHQALKDRTDGIKDIERKMVAEEKRLHDANGDAHTNTLRELDEAKEEAKQISTKMQESKDREPELNNNAIEAKNALDKIGGDLNRKRTEIDNTEARIKQLEGDRGSLYDGYEAGIPNLLKMIASENGFQKKPVGPVGTQIQLLKPEWSSILEKTLGNTLNAFLVTSRHDEKLLRNLMNRAKVRSPPVFICNPRPLDISGKEPDPEYDTILRVLKIDDPMVRDQLVINHMVEQVLLVPQRTRAQEIMFDGAPPRNVKACLSFHDTKRGEGLRLAKNNWGNISTSPIVINHHLRPRMKTDSGSQIALLKDSLQQIRAEHREVESEKRRLQQNFQRCQSAQTQWTKDQASLKNSFLSAEARVSRIEEELDKFNNDDTYLQGLKAHLEELKEELNHHGIQYGMLSAKKQDKNAEVETAQKKLKDEKLLAKDFDARLTKAESKLRQARELRHICLVEKNEIIARVAEYATQKARAEAKRASQADYVKEITDKCLQVSSNERVYVPEHETHESLEKQYEALRKRLKRAEDHRNMTDQQVHEHFATTKSTYTQMVADLDSTRRVNDHLRKTLTIRLEKWRKFQRYISSQSRANFIYLLSERGFRGKLLLDHERKALDLQVEPDRTEKKAAGRSTKTLSGGEKSFSSICLLLAIWEAMGSPLRCLDEFDVFMDNVNRAISTNMLITAARRSVNRQYIFITPNAIEGRNTLDKDVKIIRLTDPRQRTLADH